MDGIIVINKEKEYTSHDVVAKLKKKLNISKVGHTGTLDPNATGVLPILIGKGTKFSKYLINHDKIYEVELELGKKTDTADIEGKVIEEKEVDEEYVNKNLLQVLESFIGKQEQMPPMYSAIKKNGKKLYELADIVIDNHVPYGDGVFEYQGTKIGSVSSIIGSFIAQSLVLEVIRLYDENHIIAPIYQSANTIGGDEHNEVLYKKYRNRIRNLY